MAVRGVHLEGDEGEDGQRGGQQAEGDRQPRPEPVDQPRTERTGEGEGDREGEEPQAGADRAEAVHALQIQRDEEQHPEEGEEVQQHNDGTH